ncbi:hypothetical protein Hanom_Chr01g00084181 [Helianthus anomalus]
MELASETYTEKRRDTRGCRDLVFPPAVLSTTVQASATPPRGASYATVDRQGKFLFDLFYMSFIYRWFIMPNKQIYLFNLPTYPYVHNLLIPSLTYFFFV